MPFDQCPMTSDDQGGTLSNLNCSLAHMPYMKDAFAEPLGIFNVEFACGCRDGSFVSNLTTLFGIKTCLVKKQCDCLFNLKSACRANLIVLHIANDLAFVIDVPIFQRIISWWQFALDSCNGELGTAFARFATKLLHQLLVVVLVDL